MAASLFSICYLDHWRGPNRYWGVSKSWKRWVFGSVWQILMGNWSESLTCCWCDCPCRCFLWLLWCLETELYFTLNCKFNYTTTCVKLRRIISAATKKQSSLVRLQNLVPQCCEIRKIQPAEFGKFSIRFYNLRKLLCFSARAFMN